MNFIDRFLNSITMYRLVFYGLLVLVAYAVVLGFVGKLAYSGVELLESLAILLVVCGAVNWGFSKLLRAPINTESFMITALILFFVMLPAVMVPDAAVLALVGVLAMASKYLLAIKRKHIFNPVAIAAVILGALGIGNAFWWVATLWMLPPTLILGLLIVRKIRRFAMVLVFVAVSTLLLFVQGNSLEVIATSWPIIFFATIMLTEPLTTPPSRPLQAVYAVIIGVLFSLQFHIGALYSSPELALVIGNIFSYLVSSKQKLRLKLVSKKPLAVNMYEFTFMPTEQLRFTAGQFIEWTLPYWGGDIRGNRRFFTIASSPTEQEVRLGVKIIPQGSSFKKILVDLQEGQELVAAGLGGEFTLPTNPKTKIVFIAGGIGVTPFVSMIRYLLATKQKRDITLFYACVNDFDFAYMDLFEQAKRELDLKFVPVVTSKDGFITPEMVKQNVSDYKARTFYLSGPDAMVRTYEKLLKRLGVSRWNIKKDYFPGF